ncbi:alpha-1 2-mannosidase [Bacteroidia bacterium]|nr:alpha-1 2-mannosidase [Bacteroidia bacterium]
MRKITVVCLLLCAACGHKEREARDDSQFVNVFTGTGEHGHTTPAATRPFAMVQLGPDTHLDGWDASSGYHWSDSIIWAFSHTHLSGTGIGDLGDVALLPYCGADTLQRPAARFSHEREQASPGCYRVHLDNYAIDVELTSTERVGIHRYCYPADSTPRVMLDLAHILQPCWGHRIVDNNFMAIDGQSVAGTLHTSGWAESHKVSYRIEFSRAVRRITVREQGQAVELPYGKAIATRRPLRVYFEFAPSAEPLLVKCALSCVDEAGAENNMRVELPGWDFDRVRNRSAEIWRASLASVRVESVDTTVLKNFYTALYHTMLSPILWQDADGRYLGMDKQVRMAAEGYTNYTALSLWDTFRAQLPLMTIACPELAAAVGQTLVQGWREGGVLPKWPLASNYTGCMVAYPAVAVLADLQAKGLMRGESAQWAQAALRSSVYRSDLAERFAGTRQADIVTRHVALKDKYGFVPADSIAESVSWGLEMAYDDWCVARLALAAGDTTSYEAYMAKSSLWRRYFDPATRLMRGVMGNGKFRTPFNPYYSAHQSSDYCEGTAFQWSYFVPHDMTGFIAALGGAGELEAALDRLFAAPPKVDGASASGDISGLVGQYAHGNEPSHHIAYLYNWTAAPYKGQALLDSIMRTLYAPTPEGIAGNEDMGQMSAWYAVSAMGLYQVCPGEPVYALGRPMVDRAMIAVAGGVFEIVASNNSPQNKYVQRATLNGQTLPSLFIRHSDMKAGSRLELVMAPEPSTFI